MEHLKVGNTNTYTIWERPGDLKGQYFYTLISTNRGVFIYMYSK
jgi:hypothetical protein